jgi:hypothetical protein
MMDLPVRLRSIEFDTGAGLSILLPQLKPYLLAVASEIGRGHSNYLDAVLSFLPGVKKIVPAGPARQLAYLGYRLGARGGLLTALYNRLRTRGSNLELMLFDRGLRDRLANFPGIVLVDHPVYARMLAPVCRVAYLHCEIAAPKISAVNRAWCIFAPVESTAHRLRSLGVKPDTIVITGLVIEPEILPVARTAFESRLSRLESGEPLTIAFFTSGAYPKPHLRAILTAVRSARNSNHNTLIFAGTSPGSARKLPKAMVFSSRKEENRRTAELFSRIDLMVTAAHERTNWAVGLGLPLFALLPHIGPFARENFEFAFKQGVCLPLNQPEKFGLMIERLKARGRLIEMATAGWNRYPVNGAETIARYLLQAEN